MVWTEKPLVAGTVLLLAASAFAASPSKPRTAATGCTISPPRVCLVKVSVEGTPNSYVVKFEPDVVTVPMESRGKAYVLVFRVPNFFYFRPAMGDGVILKDPDQDEFVNPRVSDDDVGTPSTQPKGWRRYVWTYRNLVDGLYHYKVQFRDKDGNLVVSPDPVITNVDTK